MQTPINSQKENARNSPILWWWVGLVIVLLLGLWVRWTAYQVFLDNESLFPAPARAERAMRWASVHLGDVNRSKVAANSGHDDPGFGLLVASFWWISGVHTPRSIHVGTLLCDMAALLMLTASCRKVFGWIPGLAAGMLYALYLPVVIEAFFLNNLLAVAHFAILVIWLFLHTGSSLTRQVLSILAAGLAAGVACVVRSTFFLFPILAGTTLLFRYGLKRGGVLSLVFWFAGYGTFFLAQSQMGGGTHTFWHSFYTGLGDFPNPFGIEPIDTKTFEMAAETIKGTRPYEGNYDSVVKGRSLSLVDDNTGFYLHLLRQRVCKVLFGAQDWWRLTGFGPLMAQVEIITWAIFLLNMAGIWIAWRICARWAILFLLGYLYFSLCVVPIIVAHADYFLAGSVMQIPFAALALSKLLGGVLPSSEPRKEEDLWIWDPITPKFLLGATTIGVVITGAGLLGFLSYAHRGSFTWRNDMLRKVSSYERVAEWGPAHPEGIADSILLSATNPLEPGKTHLLHLKIRVRRGRVAAAVEDATGNLYVKPAYTTNAGISHCVVAWTAQPPGRFRVRIWDALPIDFPDYYDETSSAPIQGAYEQYGIQDYSKSEFFPRNEIRASASFFPNGHETLPFLIDKVRWGITEDQKLPGYWAARSPCNLELTLPQEPVVSRLIVHQPPKSFAPVSVLVQKAGDEGFAELEAHQTEQNSEKGEIRYRFAAFRMKRLQIAFKEKESEGKLVSIKDVSLPDPADFEVLEAVVYQLGEAASKGGYPTRLSFLYPG